MLELLTFLGIIFCSVCVGMFVGSAIGALVELIEWWTQ